MTQDRLEAFHIESVELTISDLAKSVEFYTNVLGFTALEVGKDEARLGTEDGVQLLYLKENKEAKAQAKGKIGIYHFAILLPERKYLAAFLKYMAKEGYPLVGGSDHLFSEAIYLQDPDDIGIEVYADRPRDTWKYHNGQIQATTAPLDVDDLMSVYEKDWDRMPVKTIIGHLHFHVSNIPLAREFYVDTFGLAPMIEMGNQVLFVSGEGYHHHIGLNTWNGQGASIPEQPVIGLNKAHAKVSTDDINLLTEKGLLKPGETEIIDPFNIRWGLTPNALK